MSVTLTAKLFLNLRESIKHLPTLTHTHYRFDTLRSDGHIHHLNCGGNFMLLYTCKTQTVL